jgi:hypothetical protein
MASEVQFTISTDTLVYVFYAGVAVLALWYIRKLWRGIVFWFKARSFNPNDLKSVAKKWARLKAKLKGANPDELKQIIMEADKLVDFALKKRGFIGSDMGGRLKSASAQDYRLQKLWKPHILRNKIAHEPGFVVYPARAKEAMKTFEQGLRNLGMLK